MADLERITPPLAHLHQHRPFLVPGSLADYVARYDVPGAARCTVSPTPVSAVRRADRGPLRYPLARGQ